MMMTTIALLHRTGQHLDELIYGIQNMSLAAGSVVKNPHDNAGDLGLIPGLGRSPGVRNGNPLQHCCLENSMDRGAWWATVHGVAKTQT